MWNRIRNSTLPRHVMEKSELGSRFQPLLSFVATCLSPVQGTSKKKKKNNVAYLDGLRGLAAFMVYCTHSRIFFHEEDNERLGHAFGFNDEKYFVALPFVRIFFIGGAFAVDLFFIISGYALSVSPLSLIYENRQKNAARLSKQLGCSLPRRWVRLYLPVIATTFIFMTSWHILGFEPASDDHGRVAAGTYVKDCVRWFREFVDGTYVFLEGKGLSESHYNKHMWSIPEEYRGSAIVYATILAYFGLGYGPSARIWASLGLFTYFHLIIKDGYYYALFVIGSLLCDFDLASEHCPDQRPKIFRSKLLQNRTWPYYIFLVVGLYLASAPTIRRVSDLRLEPGYSLLSYTIPSNHHARFFLYVNGAILTMISIPRIPWLRRIFESPVFQYLGKISFGFYLVHGPILWTVGDRLFAAVGRPRIDAAERIPGWINLVPLSNKGPVGLEFNAIVPQIILLPLTLWTAGVVTKMIDEPSVRLSKWLFQAGGLEPETTSANTGMEPLLPMSNGESSG